MRRRIRLLLVLVLAGALAAALPRLPAALSETELFRARDFALEGARFLTLDEVLRAAAVPADASVWDDPSAWEARVLEHPLVRAVAVERDLPWTLVFRIEEREPVALFPAPVLEPVDEHGRPLPLDPVRHRLDLPVIRPARSPDGPALTPEERRSVARELGRLGEIDPAFVATLSEVALGTRGDLEARLTDPAVTLRFHPPLTSRRLREGLAALSDATERVRDAEPRSLDLRYEDQVVVGMSRPDAAPGDE